MKLMKKSMPSIGRKLKRVKTNFMMFEKTMFNISKIPNTQRHAVIGNDQRHGGSTKQSVTVTTISAVCHVYLVKEHF